MSLRALDTRTSSKKKLAQPQRSHPEDENFGRERGPTFGFPQLMNRSRFRRLPNSFCKHLLVETIV